MHLRIHNAKKCTLDGRDCWIVSLCDAKGDLLFVQATGRYDHDATSEHTTEAEAVNHAVVLAKRRGLDTLLLREGEEYTWVRVPF
jgi:hypothetical protein